MRKLMVWGGTHPDEIEPMQLVDSLVDDPIDNVSAGIVNELGRRLGKRVVHMNMNNAYPGNLESEVYEERRAAEVLLESRHADTVIDLHTFSNDTVAYGYVGTRGVSRASLGFMSQLGITNMLLGSFNALEEHVADGVGLELPRSWYRDNGRIRSVLDRFANGPDLGDAEPANFSWYLHAGSVHISQYVPDDACLASLKPLNPVPEAVAPLIGNGLPRTLWLGSSSWTGHPGSFKPNEQGYWAELCLPVGLPDDSHWQK